MTTADPRPLRTQLSDWIETLKGQPSIRRKDNLSSEDFKKLQKLCGSRSVTTRLVKILKNQTDATQKARNLLLAACQESPPKFTADVPPSVRRRKLLQLAKAAQALAIRIQIEMKSAVIPLGTERIKFLTAHIYDPTVVLPSEDESYGRDYDLDEDGYPYPTTLSTLMESFASTLEGQAKFISSLPTRRSTSRNHYTDVLSALSRTHLGLVDSVLVANIVYVVTEEPITTDMVRKRQRTKRSS